MPVKVMNWSRVSATGTTKEPASIWTMSKECRAAKAVAHQPKAMTRPTVMPVAIDP